MNLLLAAAVLVVFAVALVGPVSMWLARAPWVSRAPRCAVLFWQCIGLSAAMAGVGAGMSLAVYRYRLGLVGGVGRLVAGLFSGHPLEGLGLYDALGLTLAADLAIVLVVVVGCFMAGTIRVRARHRRLLDLVARRSSVYPGTELLSDDRAVAYCLPGLHPRIVLSEGTLRVLGPEQIAAVIAHERGHAQERHGLVMLPMMGLSSLFGWIPYARLASREIAALLEMSADDFSARRSDPRTLARALVDMASAGWAPSCALSVEGSDVSQRVSRLLSNSRNSKCVAAAATFLAALAVAVPLAAMALAN